MYDIGSTCSQAGALKLSICITTHNRAGLIGATLESILSQLTDDCEVVVLDGASTDNTQQVVLEHGRHCGRLRYIRQESNNGFDSDCDAAVQAATGEYCWLMTDDDLLKPGAVAAVLGAIRREVCLIVLNVEARDFQMSRVLQSRWLDLSADRLYAPTEMDRLFADVGHQLKYVGCIVVRRELWLGRERTPYYGSWFVFFAVIFQSPLPGAALVIADPVISYRMSNSHTFSPRLGEIQFFRWPALVRSMSISEAAMRGVYTAEPWRHWKGLMLFRAVGQYSLTEYRLWVKPMLHSAREKLLPVVIALLPGALANALLVCYCSIVSRPYLGVWQTEMMLYILGKSPCHFRNLRAVK